MILKPHYKIILFITVVIIVLAGLLGLRLTKKFPEINKVYTQTFENFLLNSEIYIIYNEAEFETIKISENQQEINYNPRYQKIYYAIKNDDQNTVNIEIYKTNKIEAFVSGLDQNTKIQWSVNDKTITQPIPVDWAGRLSLEVAIPQNNEPLCLALIDKNISQICYAIKEVTS